MTNNLEQIAKQVSLLNRLIELLRMQEKPSSPNVLEYIRSLPCYQNVLLFGDLKGFVVGDKVIPLEDGFKQNHVQKAWSDELVKVAREYFDNLKPYLNTEDERIEPAWLEEYQGWSIAGLVHALMKNNWGDYTSPSLLEAILNRYGRSLSK